MSDSLWPDGLQHAWPPCPSPTTGVYSCPLSQWCHPTISSSVGPFSSCLQSFPASGSFPISQFYASGGQSIGVSTSASVLPMSIQDWFPLGLTGLISLKSKDSQESSLKLQFKSTNSLALSFLYSPTLTSILPSECNDCADDVSSWLGRKEITFLSRVKLFTYTIWLNRVPQVAQVVKNLLAKAEVTGDTGLIPGSGRSPAGGDGNPLQCSRLENSMDRGAWGAHGVTESQTHTHTLLT